MSEGQTGLSVTNTFTAQTARLLATFRRCRGFIAEVSHACIASTSAWHWTASSYNSRQHCEVQKGSSIILTNRKACGENSHVWLLLLVRLVLVRSVEFVEFVRLWKLVELLKLAGLVRFCPSPLIARWLLRDPGDRCAWLEAQRDSNKGTTQAHVTKQCAFEKAML